MTAQRVLVIDDRATVDDTLITSLRTAGFETTTALWADRFSAIVVAIDRARCLPQCVFSDVAQRVPMIVAADGADEEQRLQCTIDGAVATSACADAADAVRAVFAPDAPPLAEQRRRARVGALEAFATRGRANDARSVHLTRLERAPSTAVATATAPFEGCTVKQRELLDVIAREGSVAAAAVALNGSRSSMYAMLRRIAHRLQLRDAADVLRLLDP